MSSTQSHHLEISTTLLQGALAGLGGAWSMTQFTRLWNVLAGMNGNDRRTLPYSPQERDATAQVAKLIAARILNRRLRPSEQRAGSVAVHYAVGAAAGASYVALRRHFPRARRFSGAMFGAAVGLLANECLMPAAGIIPSPRKYSIAAQLNNLGEHVTFGLATDAWLRFQHLALRPPSDLASTRKKTQAA